MKTIFEYAKDNMEKIAADIPLKLLPAYVAAPTIVGGIAGKLYSDFTAPPPGEHEMFQAELMKEKLKDVLIAREKKMRKKQLQAVLDESKRSIRL